MLSIRLSPMAAESVSAAVKAAALRKQTEAGHASDAAFKLPEHFTFQSVGINIVQCINKAARAGLSGFHPAAP